jgi:triosephosphate isomerase
MTLKKLVAGNWKMHGLSSDLEEIRAIADASAGYSNVDVALCVPAILIERAARAVPGFAIGGQDVHHAGTGAHTGCTSAMMLIDAGATLTIVGHSERRDAQRESDVEVQAKAHAALACGLNVVLCVGESLEVRERGGAVATVVAQLDASIPDEPTEEAELAVAYEPIWAIGTGRNAEPTDAGRVVEVIRATLAKQYGDTVSQNVRVQYGGSVKPGNIRGFMAHPEIDGALVGGSSLDPEEFALIVKYR